MTDKTKINIITIIMILVAIAATVASIMTADPRAGRILAGWSGSAWTTVVVIKLVVEQ